MNIEIEMMKLPKSAEHSQQEESASLVERPAETPTKRRYWILVAFLALLATAALLGVFLAIRIGDVERLQNELDEARTNNLQLTSELAEYRENATEEFYNRTLDFSGMGLAYLEIQTSLFGKAPNSQSPSPAFRQLNLTSNNVSVFRDNRLPHLVVLDLGNAQLEQFGGNELQQLRFLNVEHNERLWNFSGNSLPLLPALDLSDGDIEIFSNNSLSALKNINLQGALLVEFHNNSLQILEQLQLQCLSRMNFSDNMLPNLQALSIVSLSRSEMQSLQGNQMPNLARLTIVNAQFRNFSELLAYPSLRAANLTFNNISVMTGLTMPRLEQLQLARNGVRNFTGNNLARLQSLDLSYNRLTSIQQNHLPAVRELNLRGNLLSELSLSSNHLQTIQVLLADFNMLTSFDQPAESLVHLDLSSNKLLQFSEQYLPLLLSLDLSFNTNLTTFTGNMLPRLKNLNLYLTSLSKFECGSMHSLVVLDISYNKLSDDIADQLLRCNFLNIGQIVLTGNTFANKTDVRYRLQKRYTNAAVYI